MSAHEPQDLRRIYDARFTANAAYRDKVWDVLVREFFQQYVKAGDRVLDLGCGYGEFTRNVKCVSKFAMDLNPDAPRYLGEGVNFFEQDCSTRWPLPDASLE